MLDVLMDWDREGLFEAREVTEKLANTVSLPSLY